MGYKKTMRLLIDVFEYAKLEIPEDLKKECEAEIQKYMDSYNLELIY